MATLSCRERRFELEMAPRLEHQYRYYLVVLRNLLQRLGRLAETLIDRYGKQGEFLYYDTTLEELAQAEQRTVPVQEFMPNRRARFHTEPKGLDISSAGLEVEFVRASDNEVVTRVTECEWARYYQERHPRVGYLLACCLDNALYQSLNPRLRLQRTLTLMEGGPACDFRVYALEQAPDDPDVESST